MSVFDEQPRCAIAVRRHVDRKLLASLFPGWQIMHPGEILAGHRFDRIVVAFVTETGTHGSKARAEVEREWVEQLSTKLRGADKKLEWLI
jgi:hypothetical protein